MALYDLRYALRRLLQHPAFLLTAIMTIAVGIGINTTVFSWIHSFLLRPLPIAKGASRT